jgi:hypothetical protein
MAMMDRMFGQFGQRLRAVSGNSELAALSPRQLADIGVSQDAGRREVVRHPWDTALGPVSRNSIGW